MVQKRCEATHTDALAIHLDGQRHTGGPVNTI